MKKQYFYSFIVLFIAVLSTFTLNIGCAGKLKSESIQNLSSSTLLHPGDDLQAVLDSGKSVLLQKGRVYEITETLVYKYPNQTISTQDAVCLSDYATLRIVNPELMMLINGGRQDHIVLQHVILDGNRYQLSTVPKNEITGGGGQPPMVFFGGSGAEGQQVLNNVFMSTRTWSTLKIHDDAQNTLVEGNIFLGAGVDPRGNGREKAEVPFTWGDAVSWQNPTHHK